MKINELNYAKQSDQPEPLWEELGLFYDGPFHDGSNEIILKTPSGRLCRCQFEPSWDNPNIVKLDSDLGMLDYQVVEQYAAGGLLLRGPYGDYYYLHYHERDGWVCRLTILGLDSIITALRQGNVARKQE